MAQVSPALSPHPAPTAQKTRLRELGIYELPDKRQFVVSTLYSDGCCLYSARMWNSYGSAEYWVDAGGRLLNCGTPTQWSVQDLRDTGQTASYPKPTLL